MLQTSNAIILSSVRYSDTRAIVHAYTRERGSVSYNIPVPTSRRKSKYKVMFFPLALVEITADYRPNKEVQHVQEVRLLRAISTPSANPISNAISIFLLEFWDKLLRSEVKDYRLFDFIQYSLYEFEKATGADLSSFHIKHLCSLTMVLGISPHHETFRQGYVLDVQEGIFRPSSYSATQAPLQESNIIYHYLTSPEEYRPALNREIRNSILSLLLRYYEHHYPSISSMKSPKVLSVLFG